MTKRVRAIFYGLAAFVGVLLVVALFTQSSFLTARQNSFTPDTPIHNLVLETPSGFFMQYIEPDKSIDFKIIEITPDPNIEFVIGGIP